MQILMWFGISYVVLQVLFLLHMLYVIFRIWKHASREG
jgi:hypothetical protein